MLCVVARAEKNEHSQQGCARRGQCSFFNELLDLLDDIIGQLRQHALGEDHPVMPVRIWVARLVRDLLGMVPETGRLRLQPRQGSKKARGEGGRQDLVDLYYKKRHFQAGHGTIRLVSRPTTKVRALRRG